MEVEEEEDALLDGGDRIEGERELDAPAGRGSGGAGGRGIDPPPPVHRRRAGSPGVRPSGDILPLLPTPPRLCELDPPAPPTSPVRSRPDWSVESVSSGGRSRQRNRRKKAISINGKWLNWCVCVCKLLCIRIYKRAMWCLFVGVVHLSCQCAWVPFPCRAGVGVAPFCARRFGGHCKFVLCKCLLCVRVCALSGM